MFTFGALFKNNADVKVYLNAVLQTTGYTTTGAGSPPTQQEFDRVMHTNVLGAMQAMPQVAPWVEEANGTFAFITSGMGQIGTVESSFGWLYRVSKAALNTGGVVHHILINSLFCDEHILKVAREFLTLK